MPPVAAAARATRDVSPSRNIRAQISNVSNAHRRSAWLTPRMCSLTRRSTASASNKPRARARDPVTYSLSNGRQGPRSHDPTGTGNPILRRSRIGGGTFPCIAWRRIHLVVVPRSFIDCGSAATHSVSGWSRNGTRLSMEAAMLIWSCFISNSCR